MDINNLWSEYDLNSKRQNTRCLAVNTILEGKYLVGPVLGQGGFGITYVGLDLNMEAKIAIKEYFPVELVSRDTTTMHGDRVLSLSGEKSVTYKAGLKKYVAEAQNVSQFSEIPGVVSVKDFFYANETAYIVMEFIDGISLKDYLKEKGGRLTDEEALKIMKPVLEALVQVHKAGIIHRDISPDNIMLTFQDENVHNQIESVKLIDFGAARMTEKNDQKSLTIILKHGYAPEEQYRTHGEQGPWTDVYALCAVLYRMLTGETPVPAMDRMFKDELKTLEQCGAKISANTSAAILRGLAVKKDERIQSVQELLAVLYEGAKVRSETTKKSIKKRLFIAMGAVAVAVFVIAAVFLGGKDGSVTEPFVEDVSSETSHDEGIAGTEVLIEEIEENDILGEEIAFYNPQYGISTGRAHTIICKPDGTVEARGENTMGQCNVVDWTHVVAVQCGDFHSIGLRKDGTVYGTGSNDYGQCDVSHWSDVVQIHATENTSFGLTKDGTILIAGPEEELGAEAIQNIASWTEIKSITSWGKNGLAGLRILGLGNDGILKIAGHQTVMEDGRYVGETTTIVKEQQLGGWENVENILCCGEALVGLEKDGTVQAVNLFSDNEIEIMGLDPEHDIMAEDFAGITRMKQIAVPYLCGVAADGTLENRIGYYEDKEWGTWSDLVTFGIIGSGQAIGVQADGTILEDYDTENYNSLDEFTELRWAQLVPYGDSMGISGQKRNGTALYHGNYGVVDDMNKALLQGNQLASVNIMSPDEVLYTLEDGRVCVESFREEEIWEQWLPGIPKANVRQIEELLSDIYYCVMKDGTVAIVDQHKTLDEERTQQLGTWKNIKEVCGNFRIWGLKEDGTVLAYEWEEEVVAEDIVDICGNETACLGIRKDGTAVVIETMMDDVNGCTQVSGWDNLVQIEMSDSHTIGLKKDGTVVAVGSNHCGQCDVEEWKDVIFIDVCKQCTIGLTKDGKLLMAGSLY